MPQIKNQEFNQGFLKGYSEYPPSKEQQDHDYEYQENLQSFQKRRK